MSIENTETYSGMTVPGWKLLVFIPKQEEKTKGGIYLPEKTRKEEEGAAWVGTVVAMGVDCYTSNERYKCTKPHCKVGDRICFTPYSGRAIPKKAENGYYRVLRDIDVDLVLDESVVLEDNEYV